ncbi:hypothetical protein LTV02_01660 [Nocardia yamanashiensis]|uniref:hypothetical protein n=1 Tax=Nocardia yamanashiensis TaxID=209247 RepID=UPI001E35C78D|nr:hypothetical protein [Nocardia yamanashiensis]UGT42163.1 hypothetical protein LTV02_01660 [Nocardia yamanashiensis]
MTIPPDIAVVIGYLRARGWSPTGTWRTASVWTLREFDVLVPPTSTVADFTTRLRELTRCVADAEDRSPESVWRDLTAPADTIAYRRLPDGIPGNAAAMTHSIVAVHDLIATSAHTALGATTAAGGTPVPGQVQRLLERAALTLRDDAPALEISLPIEAGDPESLARLTATRLQLTCTTLRQALDAADAIAVENIARQEISAPECTALARLAGPDHGHGFELGFRWSWSAPRTDTSIEYPAGAGGRLVYLGRRSEQQRDYSAAGVVTGTIVGLHDDPDGARWQAKVRGTLLADGADRTPTRTVTVTLGDSRNYATALAAHLEGHRIRAAGTVSFKGRRAKITVAPDSFTVEHRI